MRVKRRFQTFEGLCSETNCKILALGLSGAEKQGRLCFPVCQLSVLPWGFCTTHIDLLKAISLEPLRSLWHTSLLERYHTGKF